MNEAPNEGDVRYGHEPGECDYSSDCNGIETYTVDPYAAEIDNDFTLGWYCEGLRDRLADDI